MRRIAKETKHFKADFSVKLWGWGGEVKTFSIIEECWMVDLQFFSPGIIRSLNVLTTSDYAKAREKFEVLAAAFADMEVASA